MKRMLLSLFLLCCNSIAFAIVSLQLEAPQVQMGENFTLNLRIEGTQINSVPDLTPLQKDFTIVGTESNINYSIINGKVRAVSEWTIILTPKRSGVLPIPALQIGQEKTNPITIDITPTTNQPNTTKPSAMQQQPQTQQDVQLLAEANTTQPFVNQQVIYTVKLFNSSRLLDANYLPPQVDDALFVPFGDGRRYQVTNNGRLYAVEEQQFALFPQKSGDLKINPPVFNALVYDSNGPRRVNVKAQPTVLHVQPIPAQFKGKNWLPAKQITLSESYDKNISSLTVGSTLERTVILQAVAVPAQLLPILNFGSSDQFSIYPEKPTTNNNFKQQDLIGTSTVKVTYLLNKTGKVTIPPLTLPWFNTITGKEETSSLPGFTINVVAAAGQNKQTYTPPPATTANTSQLTTQASKNKTPEKPVESATPQTNFAWWAAGGFALAWLLTILAWRWQRTGYSNKPNKAQALKQVQEACLNNNPRQARDAMLKWGQMQWPTAHLLNLIDLENLVDDPALKQQINILSQVLYHNGAQNEWQGEALWQVVSNFQPSSSSTKKENTLPPIHRL